MKKLILSSMTLLLAGGLFAQSAATVENKHLIKKESIMSNVAYPYLRPGSEMGTGVTGGYDYNSSLPYFLAKSRASGTTVGTTTYGLGSNGSAQSRLIAYSGTKVSTVWTGSTETAAAYSDRGTFYNYNDGSGWAAADETRIEGVRSGFGQLILVGTFDLGAEMVVSHTGSNTLNLYASAPQANDWSPLPASATLTGTWARAASPEGTSDVYVIAADNASGTPAPALLFNRSSDGGITWDISNEPLEFMGSADGYNSAGAEAYEILAEGDNVYIVAGDMVNDLAVWKSTSRGDAGSWVRTRIVDFPIDNFDGNTISDVTGDGIADTLETQDGAVALLVDNAGKMHVWSGVTRLLDDTEGDAAWSFFPGVTGMFYWNEDMGADSVQYLDVMVDWDSDGDRFLGIGADLPNYGIGMTSQPVATLDPATGNIYVMFTQLVENTDFEENPSSETAQSFRDVFGIYTTDGGATWTEEVNLSYSANEFFENVYPSSTKTTVGDKVHAQWIQDNEPGNAFETELPDPIANHDVIYNGWDFSHFDPYNPTADFTFEVTPGTASVLFTNASVAADTYSWFFDDGGTATTNLVSTTVPHTYTTNGDFDVCLTATNVYGVNVTCKTVTITAVGITDIALDKALEIYPSPSDGNVHVALSGTEYGNATVEVHNMLGELMTAPVMFNTTGGSIDLNLTGLANGNYMVKVITENGAVATRQITIAK